MQYLEALGIECFVPRLRLVGAKPSEPCLLPFEPQLEASPTIDDAMLVAAKPVESVISAAELLRPVKLEASPPSAPVAAASDQVSHAQATAPPVKVDNARFTLSVWRVSDSVVAVDSCDTSAPLPTAALLQAICRACGIAAQLNNEERLSWPMVDLPNKPMGWDEARQMVANYLEGKLLVRPVTTILLFGEESFRACADVLLDSEAYADTCYQMVSVDAFAAESVVLPSLSSILHQPALKKPLWQALCRSGLVAG
ncbi:hypothetical protein SAMN02745866_03868 [Alteromonadaceae bacterium Bs31]|nr:hypothetical protein SAMN02745866_03868 [Alteromonadaceae bacterium Bs31]